MDGLIVPRHIRKCKYFMLCAAASATIITYFFKTPCFTHLPKIHCTIYGPLSDYSHTVIKNFIAQQREARVKPAALIQKLQTTFTWIKNAHLAIVMDTYHLIITMHTHLINSNDQWLIAPNGVVFEAIFYKPQYIKSLPLIAIHETELNDKQSLILLHNLIQALPQDILNFYALYWENRHTIYLFDRANNNFKLIISAQKSITHQQLYKCLRIKSILNAHGSFKKKTDYWITDLRFSNHLIVAKKGSNENGAKLF